eukprot:397345-Alexandrium_andersonii.AAC.1
MHAMLEPLSKPPFNNRLSLSLLDRRLVPGLAGNLERPGPDLLTWPGDDAEQFALSLHDLPIPRDGEP